MSPKRRKRLRLPFVRHPRDASHDFDDASYDGGTSGGAYLRHVVILAIVLAAIAFFIRQFF
ncbi:hypothetical protein [Luteibacter yeojuensis]|uniref:Uncharacterized protein n=1 Tax=Luteibacter yeojuensis TaxID=345309 RepID=A0A7X5TRJ3_9GAMM|nr:hypothetical protein [Luteibacter yeojuensis]NID17210.1 hypothetical protein [Luteibacter yeojuensis]